MERQCRRSRSGWWKRCKNLWNSTGLDSGDSWATALAAFWCSFCVFSFTRSFSVIFPVLTRQHGITRKAAFDAVAAIRIAGCISGLGVSYWTAPRCKVLLAIGVGAGFLGLLCMSVEISHHIVVTGATFYGLGRGIVSNQAPVVITRHFDRHRTKALGLYRCGACVSTFVFPVVAAELTRHYGLRGCCLLLSGIVLNGILGVTAMHEQPYVHSKKTCLLSNKCPDKAQRALSSLREEPEEKPDLPDTSARLHQTRPFEDDPQVSAHGGEPLQRSNTEDGRWWQTTVTLSRLPMFYPILCLALTLTLSFQIYTLTLDIAQDKGVTEDHAPYLIQVFAVAELGGVVAVGFVTGETRRKAAYVTASLQVLLGIMTSLLSVARGFAMFATYQLLSGTAAGALLVLLPRQAHEYVGHELFPRANAFCQVVAAGTFFAVAPVLGHFRDVRKNYDPFVALVGACMVLCGLVWTLEPRLVGRRTPVKESCQHELMVQSGGPDTVSVERKLNGTHSSEV